MTSDTLTDSERDTLASLTAAQKARCAQYDFAGLKWFLAQMKRARDYKRSLASGAQSSKSMKVVSAHTKTMMTERETLECEYAQVFTIDT